MTGALYTITASPVDRSLPLAAFGRARAARFAVRAAAPYQGQVLLERYSSRVGWQENGTFSFLPYFGGPSDNGGWLFQEIEIVSANNAPTTVKIMLSNSDFVADK